MRPKLITIILYFLEHCLQNRLNTYCQSLSPDAEGDLMCPKGTNTMVARYGFNRNGVKPAWRCYADVLTTSDEAACTTNSGVLTNADCTDPNYSVNTYCNRPDQLSAILSDGCSEEFKQTSNQIAAGIVCNEARSSRIFGGIDETARNWPWIVRIDIAGSESALTNCGGTIISDFWVLTCKYKYSY